MPPPSPKPESRHGRVQTPNLLQALRGIWHWEGREIVLDLDQETGELMGCTYEGEAVDPCPVITLGIQVRPFRKNQVRN